MPRDGAELELKIQLSLSLSPLAPLSHSVPFEGSLDSHNISTVGQCWSSLGAQSGPRSREGVKPHLLSD